MRESGPAATGRLVGVRMQSSQIAAVEAWAGQQGDNPGRPEAVRRLVDRALREHPALRPSDEPAARRDVARATAHAVEPKISSHVSDESYAQFCSSLGRIVMSWNNLDALIRLLITTVAGGTEARAGALVGELPTDALARSLTATAEDCDAALKSHLVHYSKLYEVARLYRELYIHDPLMFRRRREDAPELIALQKHVKGPRVALKLDEGDVTQRQLDAFERLLLSIRGYATTLISERCGITTNVPLRAVIRPKLPSGPELKRLRKVQLQRSRATVRPTS